MPVTLSDFINFPFNNGKGIRGDQIQVDDSLEADDTHQRPQAVRRLH